jgi:hypothetical protein
MKPSATWKALLRREVDPIRLAWAINRRIRAVPHDWAWRGQSRRGSENYSKISSYADRHLGERCIIVGGGPSLSKMDLSLLEGETLILMNRGYLLTNRIGLEPNYYIAMNQLVIEQTIPEIRSIPQPKFLNWKSRNKVPRGRETIFLQESFRAGFETDLTRPIWVGATVTYAALQMAYYMGFHAVILIGIDHSFQTTGIAHKTIISDGSDQDHFDPNYFPSGFRWQLPDLRTSEAAYWLAKEAYERAGRSVLDATLDGKLVVFPKVNLQSALDYP